MGDAHYLPQPALSQVSERDAQRWLADRQADLMPVPYFHVMFTVPAEAAEIAFHNKAVVYAILFDAVAANTRPSTPIRGAPRR